MEGINKLVVVVVLVPYEKKHTLYKPNTKIIITISYNRGMHNKVEVKSGEKVLQFKITWYKYVLKLL